MKTVYTIGAHSTDTQKFIYAPSGELAATVTAPDNNRAGMEFARNHAAHIVACLNARLDDQLVWKIYDSHSRYVVATKFTEEAAMLVALLGIDAQVKYLHAIVAWTEGREIQSAGESYDAAGECMLKRVRDELEKSRGTRE
jgi:hypothetical protein